MPRRSMWGLIAAGTTIRVVLAFTTDGQPYDIAVLEDARDALLDTPRHIYSVTLGPTGATNWPYPSGFFPFIWIVEVVSAATGLAYTSLIRLPAIAADACIAVLVHDFLGRRGAPAKLRTAAVALVALGPSFAIISGFHGQIDSLAILPAVAAVAFWERFPESQRALYAGALIGAGAAVKTTPGLMVFALLPFTRSRREAGILLASTVAVPVAMLAPWLVTSASDVADALRYRGFPGTSPLSLVLQPELAQHIRRPVIRSEIVDTLYDMGHLLAAVAAASVAALVRRFRTRITPAESASLIWLAFYIVTPAFFFQYLVWGLPFLLLAARLRLVLAVQALALAPTIVFYRAPWETNGAALVYGVGLVALGVLFAVALAVGIRAVVRPTPA